MAAPKNRPGMKLLAQLPLPEKLSAYLRGSNVQADAWLFACAETRSILKSVKSGKFTMNGRPITREDFIFGGVVMNAVLVEKARFHTQVARAFERMATPSRHVAAWLAILLRPEAVHGRPLPTKAEMLRRLRHIDPSCVPAPRWFKGDRKSVV